MNCRLRRQQHKETLEIQVSLDSTHCISSKSTKTLRQRVDLALHALHLGLDLVLDLLGVLLRLRDPALGLGHLARHLVLGLRVGGRGHDPGVDVEGPAAVAVGLDTHEVALLPPERVGAADPLPIDESVQVAAWKKNKDQNR